MRLTLWGVLIAAVCILAYLVSRRRNGKKNEPFAVVNIAVSSPGLVGGVKLKVFACSGEFEKAAEATRGVWWGLVETDALFVFLGGLALSWVSVLTIIRAFKE